MNPWGEGPESREEAIQALIASVDASIRKANEAISKAEEAK